MTQELTLTRIGRRTGSICSTYVLNREVKTINFYTKSEGVIISTSCGWICGENKGFNDFNRLNEFFVNGEVTSHNKSLDVEKRMQKGGNFTVNREKGQYDFETYCDLYIEIDNNYVRLVDVKPYQELYISEFSFEAKTMFYKRAILQVCTSPKDFPICMGTTYIQQHVDTREEDTKKVQDELKAIHKALEESHVYIEESKLAQLLNYFDLTSKAFSTLADLESIIKAEHKDEVYGE